MAHARWTQEEWSKVALELYRQNPVITMTSKDLKEIWAEQVITAMKNALPEPRWHISMNMTKVRPVLKTHLDKLKSNLQQIEQSRTKEQTAAEEQARQYEKARNRVDVFAPLVSVIAEHLFNHLKPMIETFIEARLNGINPHEAHSAAFNVHRPGASIKKLRVGVIGLLPVQEEEIKARFPYMDFTFYDKDKSSRGVKAWAANLDAIFGLTTKMGHEHENALKSMEAWERYHRVGGRGLTAVIHSIEIWVASSEETKSRATTSLPQPAMTQ